MMVENDNPPLSPKEIIDDNHLTQDVCNLEKKVKIISYVASEVPTITKCKYECRPSQLRCMAPPEDGDTECACIGSGPRPVVVPLSEEQAMTISVQSASSGSLQTNYCKGKTAGAKVGPEVSCQLIKKEYPATWLIRMFPDAPVCIMAPHPKAGETHTVYEKMLGSTGMACQFICKPDDALKCSSGDMNDNEQCLCGTGPPGSLAPRLLPVDGKGVSRMVMLEDGSSHFDADGPCFIRDGVDSCGDCGMCKEQRCVLKPDISMMNNCNCGYICPKEDEVALRETEFGLKFKPGSPIQCKRNPDIPCSAGSGDGLKRPDMCLESDEADMYDQCVCAKTHREVLAMFNDVGNNACMPNN